MITRPDVRCFDHWGSRYLPYALLIAAVGIAYSNVFCNQFLLDDEFLIIKNIFLRDKRYLLDLIASSSTAGAGGTDLFFRPLQGLLYFLIYQISELSVFSFHLLNVALHAANACLVYTLGRKLGFNKSATLIAALIWAVHPVHTEAVTYISATADPLYSMFCLIGICALLPDFSARRTMVACAAFALAILSKETAIIFPLLAMCCLFLVSDDRLKLRTYLKTWPLWLVAGIYIVIRMTLLPNDDFQFYKQPNIYSENIGARILTFLSILPDYFGLLLWPSNLHMDRTSLVYISLWEAPVLFGALLVLAAIGFVLWSKGRRGLALTWGLFWFASAHVLHTGIFLAVNSLFLEHWLYLPSIGIILGAAQSLSALNKAKTAMTVLALSIAFSLGLLTFMQNRIWNNPITFFENILSNGEKSAPAHNNLAMAYGEKGKYDLAIEHYRTAIKIYDNFPQTHHNLAKSLLEISHEEKYVAEAISELEKAIRMNPEFFQSYEALAEIYDSKGDSQKANYYRQKGREILSRRIPDAMITN
ncbi:MAG: tetratricopeptide repeat protein [Alphaproteobacteria bacterium]|nr:tetratricopeptide repeat protein [Alphaproteobacteria bacterium]